MEDYRGTGHSAVDTNDPPEVFYPQPVPDEHDREVDQFLTEHYDDGVNFGGEG